MPYIIDGNNLIGCSGDISLQEPDARKKLLTLLRSFQETRKTRVTIVFDGEPDETQFASACGNKLAVVFPAIGLSADDEIKKIIQQYSNLRDIVLVSSDRELKKYAREKGARTMNSIEFYFVLKKASRIHGLREEKMKRVNTQLSNREVDQWLEIFNGKENDPV